MANTSADALMVPSADEESAGFWEGAAAGELRIQACTSCGRLRHPPRVMCPHCRSTGRTYRPVSGRGSVWSFVVCHPPLLPAYAKYAPYNVVVVALDEDPAIRLVGNLVATQDGALDGIDPATLAVGERVAVTFVSRTGPDGTVVVMPEWVRDPGA